MNRIVEIFKNKNEKVIPFITAGFPSKKDTLDIIYSAEKAGAAMIEVGMPFSDPLADGPIIQNSSQIAIKNGVTLDWILDVIAIAREKTNIPIALMGYINPIIKYGIKKFIQKCSSVGVDGLIIPDLPPEEGLEYIKLAKLNNICPILLVSPNTSSMRIKYISQLAESLIYCVAVLGVTGTASGSRSEVEKYFNRVKKNSLCPFVVGFGIKNRKDVIWVNKYSHGAVIGSEIIKKLKANGDNALIVNSYIKDLLK